MLNTLGVLLSLGEKGWREAVREVTCYYAHAFQITQRIASLSLAPTALVSRRPACFTPITG